MSQPRYLQGIRRWIGLCLVVPLLAATVVHAQQAPSPQGQAPAAATRFQEQLVHRDLLTKLRDGGFVLYLRHGPTDNSKGDRIPSVDLNDCSTQRPLTEEGRQLMVRVGESMRRARIPIGEFRVSPLCRARESAQAAWPSTPATVDPELMYVGNYTDAQKVPIIANTRRLLSTPVDKGRNRLVLAHAPNLMDLIGYFPKEGTLVVFRPQGNGQFEYLGSVPPAHWAALLP